jgi:hypothetical protein
MACGGEVRRTADEGTEVETDSAAHNGSAQGSEASGDLLALPACEPGFDIDERDAFKACSFVFDRLCYETKVAACACACPERAGTICTSGFPQFDGEVPVSCE